MAVLARRQGLPCWEAVQMAWGHRKAAGVLGEETRVQLQLLLASYAEPESDTTGEESGDTEEEEGGCGCPFECIHYKISMRTARPLQAGLRRL